MPDMSATGPRVRCWFFTHDHQLLEMTGGGKSDWGENRVNRPTRAAHDPCHGATSRNEKPRQGELGGPRIGSSWRGVDPGVA